MGYGVINDYPKNKLLLNSLWLIERKRSRTSILWNKMKWWILIRYIDDPGELEKGSLYNDIMNKAMIIKVRWIVIYIPQIAVTGGICDLMGHNT